MFSTPAHGHVNPSLEAIHELVARGHRIPYAIPHIFEEKVAETGAEPVLYTTSLSSPDDDPEAWGTTLIENIGPSCKDAVSALPQLAKVYEGDEPDPRPVRDHPVSGASPRPSLGRPRVLAVAEPGRPGATRRRWESRYRNLTATGRGQTYFA